MQNNKVVFSFLSFLFCCFVVGFAVFYDTPSLFKTENLQENAYFANQNWQQDKVNINTAPLEELCLLKGIGPEKGKEIIKRREEKGFFISLEELLEIKGIGNKTLEQIYDNACV